MKRKFICETLLAIGILSSCSVAPRHFDSRQWNSGNPSSRGAMVQDLIDNGTLLGKSMPAVQQLLGPPDFHDADWYGYKVVTIARCRFWECRLDVKFDPSGRVKSAAVAD